MTEPSREQLLAEYDEYKRTHLVECCVAHDIADRVPVLLDRIAELEKDNGRLVKHIRRANEVAKRCGDYSMAVSEYRDEAWKERDRLRERIGKVREMAEAAMKPCEWDKTNVCTHEENVLYPATVLAALDGEDEEQP